ncbi:MAG: DUF4105 domain-containing protein [Verrucomicrobia bacterium]|nr:DUF4105 domain-containing protein [Verrucomicrobiota bacterium]
MIVSVVGVHGTLMSTDATIEEKKPKKKSLFLHVLRLVLAGLLFIIGIPLIAWAAGALYFDLPASAPVRNAAAICWVAAAVVLALFGGSRGRILILITFAGILGWWLTLRPTQDAAWQPDVGRLASANIQGDLLTVRDIRNFDYRTATDFTPRYDTRVFNLTNLRGLDLFIDYWGSPYIAHPIVSFDFGPEGHLCFSIEIRPKVGQPYSVLAGLYRRYELIYIAADERDVVRLRTNCKHEDVYLYRLTLPLPEVRMRLTEYLNRLNELHQHPEWYNEVTANCTTSIRAQHARSQRMRWDWRMLLNGFMDRMLYEKHLLAGNLQFAELKQRALINERALSAGDAADFSERIRAAAPGF